MKTALLLISLLAAPLASHSADTSSHSHPVVWTIDEGLAAPESAYLDEKTGHLFLSQIGAGGGVAKDGNGVISKLTLDGKMTKRDWVAGLNGPKGLRSHEGTLWVADIDELIGINIANGKISHRVKIQGAKFLNDVACGADGTVYVSDMVTSTIHQLRSGKLSTLASGPGLQHPNGLLARKNRLFVAAWGTKLQDDFSTKQAGMLLSLSLKNQKIRLISKKPTGNLDGLELDGKGSFIVTDWIAGKVFRISKTGDTKTLMTLPQGTADHAFIPKKGWLILPEMKENKLTAFDLSAALK